MRKQSDTAPLNVFEHNFLGELPFDDTVHDIPAGEKTQLSAFEGAQTSQHHLKAVLDDYQPIMADEFKETMAGTGMEHGEAHVLPEESFVEDTAFLPKTPTEAAFDPRLAFEIALEMEPVETIYPRYCLSELEWSLLSKHPTFARAVDQIQKDLLKNGTTFRMKAKIQAEAYLKDAHILIKNPNTSATVKANMIQWMAKIADLEPEKANNVGQNQFQLVINMG